MKILTTIEIPLFIKDVQLSKKRRATYYKKTSKKPLPKKYQHLKYNKKGILVSELGIPVIANPRAVGTPRFKRINGQEIYSGMPHHMRSKIVKSIKDSFKDILKKHGPINQFPIQLEMKLYDSIGNANWDLDNLWIYNKCFQDSLTDAGIIPDDHIGYITKAAAPEFVPIENPDDRKFVFTLFHDDREIIQNHHFYKEIQDTSDW